MPPIDCVHPRNKITRGGGDAETEGTKLSAPTFSVIVRLSRNLILAALIFSSFLLLCLTMRFLFIGREEHIQIMYTRTQKKGRSCLEGIFIFDM